MSELPERLLRHTRRAEDFPFRAVGNRVLMRRVKLDDTQLLLFQERQSAVIQVGEILSVGPRWRSDTPWLASLPWPTQAKGRSSELDDGTLDKDFAPMIRTADLPSRPLDTDKQIPELWCTIMTGDLVLFTNARILDTFAWEGDDILVYPGNWIHGVVTETYLARSPGARRYELETFDTVAPTHGDFMAKAKPGKRWA